jgi:hypothetical protein
VARPGAPLPAGTAFFTAASTRIVFKAHAFGFPRRRATSAAVHFGALAKLSFKLQAFLLDTPARFFLSL